MRETLVTPEQLCQRWQVSKKWIYNRTYRGELAHIKIGGLIRFREEDITDYEAAWRKAAS
jgi:excisionase family DNA binding protein